MVVKRVVLVGTTGDGKSRTANVLLEDWCAEGPFQVSSSSWSCTSQMQSRSVTTSAGALEVVDTPGLGDIPEKFDDEGINRVQNPRECPKHRVLSRYYRQAFSMKCYMHELADQMCFMLARNLSSHAYVCLCMHHIADS
jgi:ribosome biogenesis GTPase A